MSKEMKTPKQIAEEVLNDGLVMNIRDYIIAAIRIDRAQRNADVVADKLWMRDDFVSELEARNTDLTPVQIEIVVDIAVRTRYATLLGECTDRDWELVNAALDSALEEVKEEEEQDD